MPSESSLSESPGRSSQDRAVNNCVYPGRPVPNADNNELIEDPDRNTPDAAAPRSRSLFDWIKEFIKVIGHVLMWLLKLLKFCKDASTVISFYYFILVAAIMCIAIHLELAVISRFSAVFDGVQLSTDIVASFNDKFDYFSENQTNISKILQLSVSNNDSTQVNVSPGAGTVLWSQVLNSVSVNLQSIDQRFGSIETSYQENSKSIDQRFSSIETSYQENFKSIEQRFYSIETSYQENSRSIEQRLDLIEKSSTSYQENSRSIEQRLDSIEKSSTSYQESSRSIEQRLDLIEKSLTSYEQDIQSLKTHLDDMFKSLVENIESRTSASSCSQTTATGSEPSTADSSNSMWSDPAKSGDKKQGDKEWPCDDLSLCVDWITNNAHRFGEKVVKHLNSDNVFLCSASGGDCTPVTDALELQTDGSDNNSDGILNKLVWLRSQADPRKWIPAQLSPDTIDGRESYTRYNDDGAFPRQFMDKFKSLHGHIVPRKWPWLLGG